MKHSILKLLVNFLLAVSLLATGVAMAQSEPSLNQIYATAQAGKLDDAQTMVQQVLVMHPKSAKAFFVQAELYARQGRFDRARESLDTAEKYAPGLPFVKPEALQALRAQLAAGAKARPATAATTAYAAPQPAQPASGAWLMPLLLAAGVIAAGYFIFRRRSPQASAQPAGTYPNGLAGPQTFGMGAGAPPAYAPTYPQQAAGGLGGRIMGGVATGLAVGAGVVAAEAIGRSMFGSHDNPAPTADLAGRQNFEPLQNADMGGADFGVSDPGWDDGPAGADFGGGSSDWDN